jgi:O-antigen/teichoic acid export membrane protein
LILINKINNNFSRAGLLKYFYNSSWLVGEKFLRLFSGLFVGVFVARYLGPENYGILNYVISFVAMIAVISNLGMDEIVINDLIDKPRKKHIIIGTSLYLKFIGVFLTLLIISTSFLFHFNNCQVNTFIFIVALSYVFVPFNVIDLYFQSQVKAKYLVQANIISLIVNSLLRLFFVYIQAPLMYFMLCTILDTFIVATFLYFNYKKHKENIEKWMFKLKYAKELIMKSLPLLLSNMVIILYMRLDQIMIKEMIGFENVGTYSVAVRLTELWYFIPVAIGSSFFPALIKIKTQDNNLYYKRLHYLITFMVLMSLLIAIPSYIFSEKIITFLYGESYTSSISVFKIYIWASIFVFIGVPSGKWFIIENLNKVYLYRSIMGVICNVVLNIIFIPRFGINGAALATLISYSIQSYFSNLIFRKTRKLFIIQTKSLLLFNLISVIYDFIKRKNN